MLFTVIVPVYNVKNYLPECLCSIDRQSLSDFELILVDDGSTDGSGALCDEFVSTHGYARIIRQRNRGLLMARRAGLAHARGEYIVFLDSDDAMRSDALERIAAEIERTGADIVSFRFSRLSDFGRPDDADPLEVGLYEGVTYDEVKRKILSATFNNIWGKAILHSRIDVDTNYGVYERLMLGEDLLQLLPIVDSAHSLSHLDDVLYFYRPNDSASSATYKHSYLTDIEAVALCLLGYGDKWGMSDEGLDGALLLYTNVLRLLVRYGSREKFDEELAAVMDSLKELSPDVTAGVHRKRGDLRILLGAALRGDGRLVRASVCLTESARMIVRRGRA